MTQPSDARATPVLEGVRALVTGGTSGLGFAMSRALAEAGARVALTGRTEQRVRDAATRIARGAGMTGLVMDVRDEQSVSAGVAGALAVLGGATRTGMTPDSAPEDLRASWLDPAIMGPPVCWLASRASDGITDQRIVATEFDVIDPRQHG